VTAHDPDNKLGTLTYYASANGVESAATTTGQVTVTPTLPGTYEVYVFVHDGCDETKWGPVTVIVDCCPLNSILEIDISIQAKRSSLPTLCLDECATINSVTIKYGGADPLPDLVITNLNDIRLTWSYNDTKISFNKTNGEVCLVDSLSGTAGTYAISIIYTDPCGKTADGSVDFTFEDCTCINNAPTITPISDKNIAQGSTFNFTVSANDIDGDNLYYEIVSGPSKMTINSNTRAITWVAACSDPVTSRCHIICNKEVTIKVTDDGCGPLSDQDTFIIHVWDQLP
jgi:hypothetical protein